MINLYVGIRLCYNWITGAAANCIGIVYISYRVPYIYSLIRYANCACALAFVIATIYTEDTLTKNLFYQMNSNKRVRHFSNGF